MLLLPKKTEVFILGLIRAVRLNRHGTMNKTILIILNILTLTQVSCNNSGEQSKRTNIKDSRITNDGVYIDYTDSKIGDTCLLFVHGWDIDKTYWKDQNNFFKRKYRVVTIDLPGFGKSGKNRQSWTVENYGVDVATVIQSLDLRNVILIGHSMSGAIVLEVAIKNPTRVIGVVGVDNFTSFGATYSDDVKREIADAYKALKTNYKEVAVQYANQSLFSSSTDSTVRKRVINDFMKADSILAPKVLETIDEYPTDEKMKTFGKTIYLINSSYHPTDTSGFKKYNVPFQLLYVGPTGHYPMIENPNEFNKQLEQVIEKIGKFND